MSMHTTLHGCSEPMAAYTTAETSECSGEGWARRGRAGGQQYFRQRCGLSVGTFKKKENGEQKNVAYVYGSMIGNRPNEATKLGRNTQ